MGYSGLFLPLMGARFPLCKLPITPSREVRFKRRKATCPDSRLERSRWGGGHCLGVEQPAVVTKVRLGHKEGGSCDPSTQEDAGRTPAAQLFRGNDARISACRR